MKANVLFVDDDRILRRLVEKKISAYAEDFATMLAEDGIAAVEKLRNHDVSVVVTDLHMPKMDGFALLGHLSEFFPSVPVIVLTAFPATAPGPAFMESHDIALMEKPIGVEELSKKIRISLQRAARNDIQQAVPLTAFLRLIEIEQKTATIRTINRHTKDRGVLFFKDGELLDARISGAQGKEAASKIISWKKAVFSIQDTCMVKENRINMPIEKFFPTSVGVVPGNDRSEACRNTIHREAEQPLSHTKEKLEKRLQDLLRGRPGLKAVEVCRKWDPVVDKACELGRLLSAGDFKSCFINSRSHGQTILVKGESTVRITLGNDFPREIIPNVLYE